MCLHRFDTDTLYMNTKHISCLNSITIVHTISKSTHMKMLKCKIKHNTQYSHTNTFVSNNHIHTNLTAPVVYLGYCFTQPQNTP